VGPLGPHFYSKLGNMLNRFVDKFILKTIYAVDLTSLEASVIRQSVKEKYIPALKTSFLMGLLGIFPILFLDTNVIISVLIPITMVAGTAWFAISLASMKQKFEQFGMELTTNMFEAFVTSLIFLLLLAVLSLGNFFIQPLVNFLPYQNFFNILSFVLGTLVIGNITYKLFIGSFKYDINDAMLTGQSEAAERFYRKSLSLLHNVAENLQDNRSTQVANYYIGVAFFEIFSFLKKLGTANGKLAGYMEESNRLVFNPSMPQKEADKIAQHLISEFVSYCVNPSSDESRKSLEAIGDELKCLAQNTEEAQEMVDTRFSIIFKEIAGLVENQGETLFIKK
jgi:hypothetical protein